MILMARKTPFLAKKSYLKYFTPEERKEAFDEREDNRVPGKVFCSKRAFDMWLSKDIPISEQTRASIDVLYKQSRDMVDSFFSYDWPNAKIEVGYLPKSRRRVQTRLPLVDVPPQYRQAVVVELLAPGSNIYSEVVTENYMETLKPILKEHIITGMPFVEQARILLSLMDPRYKWVPTVQLDDLALALHSHCVFGANWRVVSLPASRVITPVHTPNLRADLNLLLKTVKEGNDFASIRRELSTVTYRKESLSDFLQRQQDIPPAQYLKTLLKLECTNQFEFLEYRLIIQNPSTEVRVNRTVKGIEFNEYPGVETLYFSSPAIKGYFRHNTSHVSQIVMTLSDRKTITETMAMIGCYCKWQWQLSEKKTKKQVQGECRDRLLRNPEALIGVTPQNWTQFMLHLQDLDLSNPALPVECEGGLFGGSLKIVAETADPEPSKVLFSIDGDWTLFSRNPPAQIRWDDGRFRIQSAFLSPEWDSTSAVIIPILDPVRSFPRTLNYHLKRQNLYDDITKHRFQTFNGHCLRWINHTERNGFSTLAKSMLKEAIREITSHSNVFIAYLYMFAGTTQLSLATVNSAIFHRHGTISLSVDRGVFRWEKLEQGGRWLLFDHIFTAPDNQKLVSPAILVMGTLEGYRFDNPKKRTADCAFGKAQEVLKRAKDLESKTVRVSGILLELVRDRTAQVRAGYSLKRALERVEEEKALERDELVASGRKRRKLDEAGPSQGLRATPVFGCLGL
nr:PB2 protein [Quaranjavirus sp.]